MLTEISSIFHFCNFNLKCCFNQVELTYNVAYFTCAEEYLSAELETSSANINVGNFDRFVVE